MLNSVCFWIDHLTGFFFVHIVVVHELGCISLRSVCGGASLERSVGCTVVVWVREKLRHE